MCAVCGAPTSLACLRVPASNSQRLPRTVDRRAAYISPPRLVCVMCTSFLPVAFGGSRCVPIRPLVLCARSTEPTDHPSGSGGLAGTPMGTYRPPGCPFLIRTPMGTRVTRGTPPSNFTYSWAVADFALTSSREYSESEDATWCNRKLRLSCVQWTNKMFLVVLAQSGGFFLAR